MHTPTIKPFDTETVLGEVARDRLVVTLENHTIVGGLFETVAAAIVTAGLGRRAVPIALPDRFLDAGALPTLHDRYGLATDRIVERVLGGAAVRARAGGPSPARTRTRSRSRVPSS